MLPGACLAFRAWTAKRQELADKTVVGRVSDPSRRLGEPSYLVLSASSNRLQTSSGNRDLEGGRDAGAELVGGLHGDGGRAGGARGVCQRQAVVADGRIHQP